MSGRKIAVKGVFSHEGARFGHFYFALSVVRGCARVFGNFGAPIKMWVAGQKEFIDFYYLLPNQDYHFENFFEHYLNRPALIGKLSRTLYKLQARLRARLLRYNNPSKLTNGGLFSVYGQYINFWDYYIYINNVCRVLDRAARHYLAIDYRGIVSPKDWPVLFAQSQKSLVDKEQEYFLKKLQTVWGGAPAALDKIIHDVQKRYGWITMSYYNEPVKSVADYWQVVKELRRQKLTPRQSWRRLTARRRAVLRLRDKKYQRLKDKRLRQIIKIIRQATFIKDSLRVYNSRFVFLFEPYFVEISRRTDLAAADLKRLTPEEMSALLVSGQKPNKHLIKRRRELYVAGFVGNKLAIRYGAAARRLIKQWFQADFNSQAELIGRVASRGGVVRGRVVVIRGGAEFNKFKVGDIIATVNTTPNYVPLLKKCRALICQEGGLTIHAAVISRELGIPCVVGISNLLQVLHDGDRVEVDAEKGIVKILK